MTLQVHELSDYDRYEVNCTARLNGNIILLGRRRDSNVSSYYEYKLGKAGFVEYEKQSVEFVEKWDMLESIMKAKQSFIPKYGFVPTEYKTVAYISLVPMRQWMKDWHPSRIQTTMINSAECGYPGLSQYDERALPVILEYRKFHTISWGVEALFTGKLLGVAVEPEYALLATFRASLPVLYRRTRAIGTVDEHNRFKPYSKEFLKLPDLPKELKL